MLIDDRPRIVDLCGELTQVSAREVEATVRVRRIISSSMSTGLFSEAMVFQRPAASLAA